MSLTVTQILKRLAEFYRIELKRGWKKELASRMGVSSNALTQWERRGRIPPEHLLRLEKEGVSSEHFLLPDDELMAKVTGRHQKEPDTPSPPPESTKSTRPILTGTVHRERRSPWHPEPRKNELLRMAAFILEVDDPEITPAFEQEIIKAHNALVRGLHPEPEPKKAINQT